MIDTWSDIFEGVDITVLPLRYTKAILITFKENLVWEISVPPKTKLAEWEALEQTLSEFSSEYKDDIDSIEFKLNLKRIKKDVNSKTKKFYKKHNLD